MSDIDEKDVLEVGFKTLFGPVQDLFERLTGSAAEQYGLMWGDSVKMRRTKRLVKGLAKTKRMLAEAGFDPQAVPDKLLLPIFDGMSVEDDENLQDMWAALLANAASPENADKVRPGFIATLKQMSPDEAGALDWIYDHLLPNGTTKLSVQELSNDIAISEQQIEVCLGALEAAGLIDSQTRGALAPWSDTNS